MSILENLQIQGIRSFGASAEDKQIISFSSPLTLILGANGCGKTTIIECLKYALTGELPPGSSKGQSFVHDPKIFDSTECLGQVKLVVRNKNVRQTITRSMKISFKRGKPSFESLDGTISFCDGEIQKQISSRCADLDAEMCQFMGVSKAIINNVIFCHQEDSSWPLDEAKKLKEKFDAIFGTTEYNKAIEKIIKMRKKEMNNLNSKEADLKVMNHIKKEAEDKTVDLQNGKLKLQDLEETLSKFEEDMKPIQGRLEKIRKIEMEASDIERRKIELSTSLKNYREQISKISLKIKKHFQGDKFDLDHEIRNFHEKMNEKETQLRSINEKLKSVKENEKKIQSNIQDLDRQRITLINQRQQEQEYISDRAKKIEELCRNLKITIPSNIEELSSEQINLILSEIKKFLGNDDKAILTSKQNFNKIDNEKQSEVDKLREQKASTESDIQSKKKQNDQLNRDLRKIQTEIRNVETSANKLKKVTEEIEKLNSLLEKHSQTVNLEEIKSSISDKRLNVNKLQEQLDKLDEQLEFINSIAKLTQEIQLKEKDLEKREKEFKRIKNKNIDNLKEVFGMERLIDRNFKRNTQNEYENLQKQIKQLNENINKSKLKQRELELTRKMVKSELGKYEKELQMYKDKIFDECPRGQYKELVEKCKENIAKLQLEHGALKSSEAMYKKYIKKIEEYPCCPLCHKDMASNEATDITNELSDEICRLPENIEKTEYNLKKEQTKYEKLLDLKPLIEKVERLEIDLPKFKENLQQAENELIEITDEIESSKLLLSEPTIKLNLVNSMLGDMSLLDEAIKDIERFQNEINLLKAKLPEGSSSTASLSEVQLQKTSVNAELKSERSDIDKLQQKYDKDSDILTKLRESRNIKKDEQLKLQEGVQALSQLKTRQDEISKEIETLQKQITLCEDKLDPLKDQLNAKLREKQIFKDDNTKLIEQMTKKLDTLKKIEYEILRYTKEINQLAELDLCNKLEALKSELKHYMNEQTVKAKENTELTGSIEQIKLEISNQEILERDLKDNRELKLLQEKEKIHQDKYDQLNKEFGELDFSSVRKEKEEFMNKLDTVREKKGEVIGQKGEINNIIKKLNAELNDKKYKDSIKNYRKCHYEVEILKNIIDDLGQYRIGLEWGLMKFHSEKMEKINRLIREFWRQIYRGNDIDYIQIQTDEMKTDSADRRRNYNYRVVQCKNGKEIDMRGRCSAGQRVLASLIIRMALAETFSCNCGILALDEPTTNLDRSNIISLCEALNNIVEDRRTQRNFMLIIITHDEEFISSLGKIRSYQKVFRNNDGKSEIRKVIV